MLTDNHVFIKVRVILIFCTSIGIHKKPSPRLSTGLYNLVYFNRWDQFNQSMGSSDTRPDNYGQTT